MAILIKFKVNLVIEDQDLPDVDMIQNKNALETLVAQLCQNALNDLFDNSPVSSSSCRLVDCQAMQENRKKGKKKK